MYIYIFSSSRFGLLPLSMTSSRRTNLATHGADITRPLVGCLSMWCVQYSDAAAGMFFKKKRKPLSLYKTNLSLCKPLKSL